jgi:hypothetical protein
MQSSRSERFVARSLGIGLVFGLCVGIVQLGLALYNSSVYVSDPTRVSETLILLLWSLGWLAAGIRAGKQTKNENAGIIAGLCGGFIGIIVDIAAPLILDFHRYPWTFASVWLGDLSYNFFADLPYVLIMIGLSAGVGFLGSWFMCNIFPRTRQRQQPISNIEEMSDTDDMTSITSRHSNIGIYVLIVCVALVLINLLIAIPLSQIWQGHAYNSMLSYDENITTNAYIALLCTTLAGAIGISLGSLFASFFASKRRAIATAQQRYIPGLWIALLGSAVNISMIIIYVYSGRVTYNTFYTLAPGSNISTIFGPFLPYMPMASIILFLGATTAVALGLLGAHLGARGPQAQPKSDHLTLGPTDELVEQIMSDHTINE